MSEVDWFGGVEGVKSSSGGNAGRGSFQKKVEDAQATLRDNLELWQERDNAVGMGKAELTSCASWKQVGKNYTVMVKIEGDPEPFEAEIVDERVVTPDSGSNNMRNYVDGEAAKPIPHYRLFNLKTGNMLLIPHQSAKIKYEKVPSRVHAYVQELHAKVENKLISLAGTKGPVEMVELQGGCFKMGSEKAALSERPVHEVCLKPFKIDKFEVTQSAFQATMGHNPSMFKGADRPAEMVTWDEADDYCKKSDKRLPTEAEWEFAARGGTNTEYYWGNNFDASKANFCDSACILNIRNKNLSDGFPNTAPVGSFPANPFGLHDMAGNVWEWVDDWYNRTYYTHGTKNNPKGYTEGEFKSLRGGSWVNFPDSLRSSFRRWSRPDVRFNDTGFRCAKSASPDIKFKN